MFTVNTELPIGRAEAPRELQAAFAELVEAVTPLAGERDPDTLAEVAWSAALPLEFWRFHRDAGLQAFSTTILACRGR